MNEFCLLIMCLPDGWLHHVDNRTVLRASDLWTSGLQLIFPIIPLSRSPYITFKIDFRLRYTFNRVTGVLYHSRYPLSQDLLKIIVMGDWYAVFTTAGYFGPIPYMLNLAVASMARSQGNAADRRGLS